MDQKRNNIESDQSARICVGMGLRSTITTSSPSKNPKGSNEDDDGDGTYRGMMLVMLKPGNG